MTERERTLRELLAWVTEYGDINLEQGGDNILMDPLLRGGPWTEDNVRISDECSTMSTIHSSKYHACEEIAGHIKALLGEQP